MSYSINFSGKNAGFSDADSTWLPLNDNYKETNLESEQMETNSHWQNMQTLLSLRKSTEALMSGDTIIYYYSMENILVIKRGLDIVSLANFGPEIVESLDLGSLFGEQLCIVLFSSNSDHVIGGEYLLNDFQLNSYEGVVLKFIDEEK